MSPGCVPSRKAVTRRGESEKVTKSRFLGVHIYIKNRRFLTFGNSYKNGREISAKTAEKNTFEKTVYIAYKPKELFCATLKNAKKLGFLLFVYG